MEIPEGQDKTMTAGQSIAATTEEISPYPSNARIGSTVVQASNNDTLPSLASASTAAANSGKLMSKKGRIRINDLKLAKSNKERWVILTAYDVMSARIFDMAKIPCLIVGDSASNVHLGHSSTIPITLDEILLFTKAVCRGTERALVVADLPFGSYQCSPKQALESSIRLLKEGGAHAVKLEGGSAYYEHVKLLTTAGIPVMAHIGFTPQFENLLSGFRVQGRETDKANQLIEDALKLEEAGAFACVLEMVPAPLAKTITDKLLIPTVGIGAGPNCDAQVLVWQDMSGFVPPTAAKDDNSLSSANESKLKVFKPKFVKRYADLGGQLLKAAQEYYYDVRQGTFPAEEHSFY